MFYLALPFIFLKFWYFEAPKSLLSYFLSVNKAVLQLISLPLLIRTYFRPWKNEYRKGLIWFSIFMGIFIKSFVIVADILVFIFILFIETAFFIAFLLWPVLTLSLIII